MQLLHAIIIRMWVHVLVVRLDKMYCLVQIYIIFFLKAHMVLFYGLNIVFVMY
jgi:hypothetical protein